MARQPRMGFASAASAKPAAILSPPRSRVRIVTGAVAHGAQHRAVGARPARPPRGIAGLQEEELRPEQPDAVGAVGERRVDLVGHLDVGLEGDEFPVEGLGGQVVQPRQARGGLLPRRLPLRVARAGVGVRLDHDDAPVPVDADALALPRVPADVREAEHRRDAERTGEDGRVGRAAAPVRGDADDPAAVQAEGVRRHERAGDDDRPLGGVREARALALEQLGDHPLADVVQVEGALLQVDGTGRAEAPGELVHRLREHPLGVVVPLCHAPTHGGGELGVFEHQQVRLDHGVARPGERAQLGRGAFEGGREPPLLGLDAGRGDEVPGNRELNLLRKALEEGVSSPGRRLGGNDVQQEAARTPELARWAAMPLPITPAPSTATLRIRVVIEKGSLSGEGDCTNVGV